MTAIQWSAPTVEAAVLATVRRYLAVTDATARAAIRQVTRSSPHSDDPVYAVFSLASVGAEYTKIGNQVKTSAQRQIGKAMEDCWRGLISIRAGIADPDSLKATRTEDALGISVTREYDCVLDPTTVGRAPREFLDVVGVFRDGCIQLARDQLSSRSGRSKNEAVLAAAEKTLEAPEKIRGVGFEIRQCYKSADSKRKQGDIQAAAKFYEDGLVPVMIVFCRDATQMEDYRRHGWVVFEGDAAFGALKALSGYDLAHLLEQNRPEIAKLLPNLTAFFDGVSVKRPTEAEELEAEAEAELITDLAAEDEE